MDPNAQSQALVATPYQGPRFYSFTDAGKMAGGQSLATLWRRVADGTLATVKIGRRTVITTESLHAWLDACARGEWKSPDKFVLAKPKAIKLAPAKPQAPPAAPSAKHRAPKPRAAKRGRG